MNENFFSKNHKLPGQQYWRKHASNTYLLVKLLDLYHDHANVVHTHTFVLYFMYIILCYFYFFRASMPVFPQYLSAEQEEELRQIANAIVAPGKGILAADESTGMLL
jgi:hypothetical protein